MNRKLLWIVLGIVVIATATFLAIRKFRVPPKPVAQTETKGTDGATRTHFLDVVPISFHAEKYREIPIGGEEAGNPKVSPQGNRIVLRVKRGGKAGLDMVELPDGKVTTLDLGLDDVADPSWSADGNRIVLAGAKKGAWEIYRYDLPEKKLVAVTNDPQRKKSWPRFSPYRFGQHYRIAYTSEEKGRKDIWWVRESGEYDQPITVAPEKTEEFKKAEYWQKESNVGAPAPITTGGDCPDWSPSGNLLIYRTGPNVFAALAYSYYDWWRTSKIKVSTSAGILSWAPNQSSWLEYDSTRRAAAIVDRPALKRKPVLAGKSLTSSPAYFPDGRGFAYTTSRSGQSVLAIEPYDDPLGDVANLWMFGYSDGERKKLARNQLLFLETGNDQIYTLYDTEAYEHGTEDEFSNHARPYLVTSDAVLETFYAAFSALYANAERTVLAKGLTEFCAAGIDAAREKKVPADVDTLFRVGLALLKPETAKGAPPQVREEVGRIESASALQESLFGKKVDYRDFFIRGKYERDKDLQGFFRALKWFQAFTFDLSKEKERKHVADILAVANAPKVSPQLANICSLYGRMLGESRYRNPLNLKELGEGALPEAKSDLPWIKGVNTFRLLPPIYTLDAFIFDELITHLDRGDTVGTIDDPRMLPKGLDIMAAFGSQEARKILVEELKEGRFANYERHLDRVAAAIGGFPRTAWDANLYQNWLDLMGSLAREPENAPAFIKSPAWKRKQLNTALGSWVNLRYETIAMVEQVAAEAGEGGYEVLDVGKPRGYVEPNPEFFQTLEKAFSKMAREFGTSIPDQALRKEIAGRLAEHRAHLKTLETIARKELAGEQLTDQEYEEILVIGRTVEHFIQVISSASGDEGRPLSNPEPIRKIVDVQKDDLHGGRLYEALGHANEVDVAVPYFGRRQIVKGPVYSYYEFVSPEALDSAKWRAMKQPLPAWIRDFYGDRKVAPLSTIEAGKGEKP
jgi:hypothetical protein